MVWGVDMPKNSLVRFIANSRDTDLLKWNSWNEVVCCCGKKFSDASTAMTARNVSIHWRGCINAMEILKGNYPDQYLHYKTWLENNNFNSIKMRNYFADSAAKLNTSVRASEAISFDHIAQLNKIQSDIIRLMITIAELGDSISASEHLTNIIDDLLEVKMMIVFSETMKESGFRICTDTQNE